MSRAQTRGSRNRICIWNWMGTIFVCLIPGVNIIALFLFRFLAKAQPKRTFAGAALLLMLLFAILTIVAFIVFPAQLLEFAEWLRSLVQTQPAVQGALDVAATATIAPIG